MPSLNFDFVHEIVEKDSKLVNFGVIGRHPYLFEMARIVGPQIHELAICFIKQTPF